MAHNKDVKQRSVLMWLGALLVVAPALFLGAGCGGGDSGGDDSTASSSPASSSSPAPSPNPPVNLAVEQERIAWGANKFQFADLYRPNNHDGPLPVVIMIHGGCWSSVYGLDFQAGLAGALAERGFAVWNIEYRSLGNGGEWPVMFTDVAAAADFLPSIAEQYQLDVSTVTVIGHSAGGHLALWLASRGQIPAGNALYQPQPLAIDGVISLAGIGDLTSRACGASARRILDGNIITTTEYQARLAIASPIRLLPTNVSTLLLSGNLDSIVPPNLAEVYVSAAQLAGDDSEHLTITGADHFDLIDPAFMDMTLLEDALNRFMAP